MPYKESISLKIVNNTSLDQKIGLLGGNSTIYANSNNDVLVEWNLSTEPYSGNTVTLETTIPVTVELKEQNIQGVVNALNSTGKAIFNYSGTTVYATSLTDNSVSTAILIIGTFDIQGYTLEQTDFYTSGFIIDWDISSDGNWLFIANTSVNELQKYPISTPFDMSTVSIVASQTQSWANGFTLADNGNYLYENIGSNIVRYPLVAPYDISVLSFDQTVDIGVGGASIEFTADGKTFYVTGGNTITTFSLSTAWDITTFTLISTTSVISIGIPLPPSSNLRNIKLSPDGVKLFVFLSESFSPFVSGVYQCTCAIPFNIDSATYDGVILNTTESLVPQYGGVFNQNGTKIITLYTQGLIPSQINQFNTYN
jgi:hypothetical protein